ncbi:hypothetical protein UACE39S_00628 [Ureibacillus acetophenoni]
MKKVIIGFLIFLSFAISVYLLISQATLETKYGPIEVILFSIPFAMCLANINLTIVPKILQKSYTRYKKGIESIFLSITIILFTLHIGLILLLTNKEFNILFLVPVTVGIVLVTSANTLPRFKIDLNNIPNNNSNHVWNVVIRPFSIPLFLGGLIMLPCAFLPSNLMMIGFFSILLCTLIASFYMSYRAYQSHS